MAQAEAAAGAEKAAGKAGLLSRAGREASAGPPPRRAPVASSRPISVVVALILALIALGYELYKNWGTIWPAIKRYAGDATDYIRGSWDKLIRSFEGIPAAIGHIASACGRASPTASST